MERVPYKSYREYFKEREEKRIKEIQDKMNQGEMLMTPHGTYAKHWSYDTRRSAVEQEYVNNDIMTTLRAYHSMSYGYPKPNDRIEKVIFNNPATIVIWADGTKTIIKCDKQDEFDPEKGLAMAIAKKYLGTNKSGSNYYDVFEKWVPKKEYEIKTDLTAVHIVQDNTASKIIDKLVNNAIEDKIKKSDLFLYWIRRFDVVTFRDGHVDNIGEAGTLGLIYNDKDINDIVKITRYNNNTFGEIVEEVIYEEESNETI